MDPIDISVVIPTCRRESQLLEAIDSVLRQSGVSIEVIVVDDGGEKSAQLAVASVADARVRYIARATPSHGRPALVRNDGAAIAQGRYLYFLDDDDVLKPDTLAVMLKALDSAPTVGMAFGVVEPFGDDPEILRREKRLFRKGRHIAQRLGQPRELGARQVFLQPIFVNSACMVRRSAFALAGGYDADIPICEDAEFWGRIAHSTGFLFVDRPVVGYRTGASSMMHDLVEGDGKLHISYRRIREKYRRAHGWLNFWTMKFRTRAVWRLTDALTSALSRDTA